MLFLRAAFSSLIVLQLGKRSVIVLHPERMDNIEQTHDSCSARHLQELLPRQPAERQKRCTVNDDGKDKRQNGREETEMQKEAKEYATNYQQKKEEGPSKTEQLIRELEEQRKKEAEEQAARRRARTTARPAAATHARTASTGNDKLFSVLSYFTWLGWLIAFFATGNNRSESVKKHLNRALLMNIAAFLTDIPLIGTVLSLAIVVVFFAGVFQAVTGSDSNLPIVDDFRIIK